MKEIEELFLPDEVHYMETHEWARDDGTSVTVGINDYAQDQLGGYRIRGASRDWRHS